MAEAAVAATDARGWLHLAHARWAAGERQGARDAAAEAVDLDPDNAELVLTLAHFDLNIGDLVRAGEGFRAALALDPGLAGAWSGTAEVAFLAGAVETAIEAARRAAALAPGGGRQALRLGQFLIAGGGDPVEAEAALRAAFAAGEGGAHPHLTLAEALLRQDRRAEALAEAALAHEADPENAGIRQRHAEFHIACGGDVALAERELRALVEAGDASIGAYAGLGDALWRLGRNAEAIQALEATIAAFPESGFPHERLGHLLIAMGGDPVRAQAAFRAAILFPGAPEHLYIGLSEALKRQDRAGDAYQVLQEASALFPLSHASPWTLGLLILEVDDGVLAEAEACFRQVMARHPGHGDAHLGMAEVYRRSNRIKDAVASFRAGVALNATPGLLRVIRFRLYGVME
ncbi:MAG: hypothetical protein JWO24_1612 [Rhodospirillales bacterium]|nr:hypothetical protein [Rhodospirillales bacterium]